jgi:hypothetical protein
MSTLIESKETQASRGQKFWIDDDWEDLRRSLQDVVDEIFRQVEYVEKNYKDLFQAIHKESDRLSEKVKRRVIKAGGFLTSTEIERVWSHPFSDLIVKLNHLFAYAEMNRIVLQRSILYLAKNFF